MYDYTYNVLCTVNVDMYVHNSHVVNNDMYNNTYNVLCTINMDMCV